MEASTYSKRKPGRPSLGRTDKLKIRLTPKEKATFERIAEEHGLALSDWVRANLRASSAAGAGREISNETQGKRIHAH
jgi:hypothetical protein